MQVQENYSLKNLNTFGIDACAKYFVEIKSINKLKEFIHSDFAKKKKLILGGGSNIILTKDFDGIAVKIDIKGKQLLSEDGNHFYVQANAGENWHEFVLYCLDNNYAGIENLSYIPGNVGTSPIQNIGAYGVELKDVFHSLKAISLTDASVKTFTKEECEFGYRNSVFKNELKGEFIIVSVTFKLNKHPKLNTSYGAIEKELEQMGIKEPDIKDISNAVINIRKSKLPDPDKIGNVGSFFKNPVISTAQFDKLQKRFPNIAAYPNGDGLVKIAAGWLIDNAGWKGKTYGSCGVHQNQALVLINMGGATGEDILQLSQEIIEDIKLKYGIKLEREVNVI